MQVNQYLENALHSVDRAISPPENEIKRINSVLAKVVDLLISEMKKGDSFFDESYERILRGGSFHDGLRVGKINEFDLGILLRIPSRAAPAILKTNIPGFVTCKIRESNVDINSTFLQMLDDGGFVKTTGVCQWLETITTKALNAICSCGELKIFPHKFKVTTSKSVTIHLQGNNLAMDVDLTPCFVFKESEWPEGYRTNPVADKLEFLMVPQMSQWRLSFQEQERQLMDGKQFSKPALNLLKRLRDHQGHNAVANYYIKTIFLWESELNPNIFNKSLAHAFLAILDKYVDCLEKKQILCFWDKSENLLAGVSPSTLANYAERLKYIRRNLGNYSVNTYMGV